MKKTVLISALILGTSVPKLYAQTYIENQNSNAQTANFNISGVGKAGSLEITNGNLMISYPGDAGILKSTNNSRVMIGASSSFTFTLGPYLTFEGIDYSGTGLGGNLRLNMPASKNYTLAYGGLTKFTFSDGKLRLGDANIPNLATIESFTPDMVPSTVGGTYESGFRVFNTGKVIDVGFSSTNSYGWIQSRNGSSYGINYELKLNPNGGLVSIGSGGLDVNGNILSKGAIGSSISNANIGGFIYLKNPAKTANGTASTWKIYNMSGVYGNSLQFWAYDNMECPNGLCNNRFTIMDNGNVGIGTANPVAKLSVAGNILAEEVKVKLQADWPDYVFTPSYNLPSLKETEQHIKEKGHLPGIPSAEEVKNNGVDLGDMNARLLQKIEELTLHLIELKKENEALNTRMNQLENSNQRK